MISKYPVYIAVRVAFALPLLLFLIGSSEGTEPRLSKKMNQVIAKLWKNKEIKKTAFLIPPNLLPSESTEVYKVSNANNELLGFMVLNKAYSCKVGGCSVWSPSANQANYEPFYYVIVYSKDLTIKSIKILEYYSEYGYEITSKKWLAQFMYKTGCNLEYEKNIDGISGATISVKSMIYDVKNTCNMMQQLDSQGLLPGLNTQAN